MPAFRDGKRPYGTWAAKNLWVTQAYADRSKLRSSRYDLGMIVLKKRLGQGIEPLPVRLYPDRFGRTELFGYPAGAMRGRELRVCSSPTWAGDGYSYLDGVISTGNPSRNTMTTSYFGRAMRTLLNDAENR
jgi:hypothetical protein